ncbi:hypothetical protein ACD591_12485 [Rufibacter glacialis]|uniref:DUF4843 domain-containing protein n=1 Tax=Rufibacter glacialis TaxID=1259555 RepID=A0A5M8QRD5_9BACT|nr:hypothetical protein [Rufibacter glacialis]KAA6437216.1 hypothetical protein FOE74_01585 [Rufibacter glacialis]GGK61091.1 hypothetical protein GCM10011405_06550 [Rufibacter glacialis]
MRKLFNYAFLLLAGPFLLAGCLPEEGEEALKYKGPEVVEFKNQYLGVLSTVLQSKGILTSPASTVQTDSSRTITPRAYRLNATTTLGARTVDSVLVQLVGPQRSTETVVNFEVVSTSTAVKGTDYTFDARHANNTVTIPANSSQGYILIRPIAGGSAPGTTKRIILKLTGNQELHASPNYDNFYLSIYQPTTEQQL